MRDNEVPQDNNVTLAGERKAIYALNGDGEYTIVGSTGSKVEETVTVQAINELLRLRDECRDHVEAGLASTLEYHMYACRMDLITLAQSVGMFGWRVRRHLKPSVFARLNQKTLALYADALGISTEALQFLPPITEQSND